jgi:hypothetical protein
MHFKDGTPANIGDIVKVKDYGSTLIGVLVRKSAGSSTCNGSVDVIVKIDDGDGTRVVTHAKYATPQTVTLGECEKIA